MSANYHGETTVRCYNDCAQAGCPSHRIRLVSRHGGFYVEQWDADRWTHRVDLPFDYAWIRAIARLLADDGTPVKEVERERATLEMTLREVRALLISDGYHRPNIMLLKIDAALGEEHE